MSVTAHMHEVKTAKAFKNGATAWITFESVAQDSFSIFMPFETALEIESVFKTDPEAAQSKKVAA